MLRPAQVARWARRFGVADAHVRLDHLLSHIILAVGQLDDDDVVLFGGTALCRTHLTTPPWLRLSEDLDLLIVGDPRTVPARLELELPRALRREFPTRSWTVAPSAARTPSAALLSADGFNVRVQLVPATAGWAAWRRVPTQRQPVDLRYEDLPVSVDLAVPTVQGFAAMKLAAWEDRRAPRDLFDLAGLASMDAYTATTLSVFVDLCGRPPDDHAYHVVPESTDHSWHSQLAHQAADLPEAARCLALVAEAVDAMQP
jgi:predicted nucleotidyltransferase component of viral defense system